MHLLLLSLALGLLALTNWRLRHLDPCHLQTQFVYCAEDFHAITASWSKQGQLGVYRLFVALDFITLVSYGAFGYLWVAVAPQFGVYSGWRQMVALLLPVAAVADACENLLHLGFTSSSAPSAFPRAAYPLAGIFSTVKFLAISVFALVAVYALYQGAG